MSDFIQHSMFPTYKITKPIRLIELFAGIGSQAKALKNIGANFEHYRVCEFDKYAIKSYNAIHGTNFVTSDITQLSAEDLGIVDTDKYEYIMTYSFPCTDLSQAGQQRGMSKGRGTRSGLLWEVERLLKGCNELPQILLMENVPQVHGVKNIADFEKWCEFLRDLGYTNFWQDLNAKDYGIPQNRNRCFMVSILGDWEYTFPVKQKLQKQLADVVVFDREVDLSKLNSTQCNAIEIVATKLGKDKATKTVRSSGECSYDRHDWNIYGINLGVSKDFVRLKKMLSQTLKANNDKDGYLVLDNWKFYVYNGLERFRLMGFTDSDFEKAQAGNSNSQLYKQAGNSIVVQVLEAIFKQLL